MYEWHHKYRTSGEHSLKQSQVTLNIELSEHKYIWNWLIGFNLGLDSKYETYPSEVMENHLMSTTAGTPLINIA